MDKQKKSPRKNQKDREEYGAGYDISVNDLNVIGQNNSAKKKNANDRKKK